MEHRFPAGITMSFERQKDEAHGSTLSFEGTEEAFALNRKCAGIVVGFAVNQQQDQKSVV